MADPLSPGDVEHEDDRDRRERELERELEGERYARPQTHCPRCLKPLEAQAACPACGDADDVERTEERHDGMSGLSKCLACPPAVAFHNTDAPPSAERPAVWIRPDLSGLALVFDSLDTGDRRRAEDQAA